MKSAVSGEVKEGIVLCEFCSSSAVYNSRTLMKWGEFAKMCKKHNRRYAMGWGEGIGEKL